MAADPNDLFDNIFDMIGLATGPTWDPCNADPATVIGLGNMGLRFGLTAADAVAGAARSVGENDAGSPGGAALSANHGART